MSADVRQAGIALKACVQMIYRVYPGSPCPRCDGRLKRYGRAWTLFTGPSFLKCPDCKFIAWKSRPAPIAVKLAQPPRKQVGSFVSSRPLVRALDTLRSCLALALVLAMGAATSFWLVSGKDVLIATEMSASAASAIHVASAIPSEWHTTRTANSQPFATVDVQPYILEFGEASLQVMPVSETGVAWTGDISDAPPPAKDGQTTGRHRRSRILSKHR